MHNDLTSYLTEKRFARKTIKRIVHCANHYINWLTVNNIHIKEATYKDLINYITYLQKSKSKQVTNEHLKSISYYYRSADIPDIAYQVRIKGIERKQQILFTEEELDHIYHSYLPEDQQSLFRHSNKILLSFSIYQALDTSDMARLEIQHLNLQTGKLYVPASQKRKVARTLDLVSHQILQLHYYIENHRDKSTEKLISPQAANENKFYHQLRILNKQMRHHGCNLQMNISCLKQFRQSRITLWIKQYGLRKTQYYAGFKSVNSVESYKQKDSEDLRKYILQFHPLQ
ncbi:tyrosine-type recombinase/integrase [Cardinium endosymbiont of Culicoides punctatus]|uniref:tyrosine-type recombinase/integrase n=1 Tax=Cardinium endosymbiont of Culicoides punctatus TaxID=2304601 RepID=UPI001058B5A8|nr:phage integrase N-terminal SAM-like domain-containing protein [Cardinium endosymbiont of Culicoides punctatus]TDG95406.1 hypothetical protein CCPUN_03820 [Cardinium endosymbiont of Culicoides punctatus]